MEYLLIGSGVAGISAATAIRELDGEGRITVLSDEPHPFYSRIRLPEFLAGRLEQDALQLKRDEWYREQRIDLRLRQRVVAVDPVARTVRTDSDAVFSYDRLLLATGGFSFLPPIPGADKAGVFTLRTLADAIRIKEYAASVHRLAVVGGGVLGLEAGNGLRAAGCEVTVVEFFDRLLPRQTDPAGSGFLKSRLEAMGFRFVLGATVQEILGRDQVDGLQLADGRRLECDMVIIAAGIRANAVLAQEMGLEVDRGVVVDDRMATSLPAIYAAGDLVQHRETLYGIWPVAQEQGAVAGANMAGGERFFAGMVPANMLKVAGVDLFAVGDIDADGKLDAIVQQDSAAMTYRKLVLDSQRRPVGAILFGDLALRRRIVAAIDGGQSLSPEQVAGIREGGLELL